MGYALAGGLAVVVLLVGAWLRGPIEDPEVANTTTTIETSPVTSTTLAIVPGPDQVTPDEPQPEPTVDTEPPAPAVEEPAGSAPDVVEPAVEEPVEKEFVPEEPAEPEDTTPPSLVITSPADGAVVHEKTIEFKGTSEPGAVVTSGRFKASMKDSGAWSIKLKLKEGRNGARFTATDEAGNTTTKRISVTYEPKGDEPPPKEPPPEVDFTAHATYGSVLA